MRSIRSAVILGFVAFSLGCGGSDGGTTDPNANPGGGGGGKTMTATYNGAAFNPNMMTSVYANGTVSVIATDGTRAFQLTGLNFAAVGTYSFATGNSNSGLITFADGQNFYATASGSVSFTVLQVGRVAGSFTVQLRNSVTPTAPGMTLVGTFDIKSP